jgi:TPR repeat protein
MYCKGVGVEKDWGQAVAWYRKSAELGNVKSMLLLGLLLRDQKGEGVPCEAVGWIRKSAGGGCVEGMVEWGHMLLWGRGVEVDRTQACAWYRRAAAESAPAGMVGVGVCMMLGYGAEQNVEEAMRWLRKGAEGDHVVGMVGYGSGLVYGLGDEDVATGMEWLRKAARRGTGEAVELLRRVGSPCMSAGRDEWATREWVARAAEMWGRSETEIVWRT